MIIHVKDSFKHPGKGPQVIKQELDALERVHKTGVNFHIVDQGTRLGESVSACFTAHSTSADVFECGFQRFEQARGRPIVLV